VSSSSSTMFFFLFSRTSLLISSPHAINQSAILLTSSYLGQDSRESYPAKRADKRTTSVVVAVDPLHVSQLGEFIRPFSHVRMVTPTYSASKSTQCRKCWRFGHSAPLFKEEAQACPICTLLHHRSANRCANQGCPKGGFAKSAMGCCNASPSLCINCGGQHASFDGTSPIRREILSALRPPRDQDIPDAPDVGLPQTTP